MRITFFGAKSYDKESFNRIKEQYPELEGILEQLTGQISTDQMAELTYQVDVLGRTVDEVAQEFLVSLGLLSA